MAPSRSGRLSGADTDSSMADASDLNIKSRVDAMVSSILSSNPLTPYPERVLPLVKF